jgi:predicted nucleotide-binding protein
MLPERPANLSLLARFRGPDGTRYVIEAISDQILVHGDAEVARQLAAASDVDGHEAGRVIIEQHAAENDLFLILAGSVSITVNGREVAQRQARQTVGEMSLVDPSSRRSATVIAREETVTARLREQAFAQIAQRHPELWRRIAIELADRLRQRNLLVRARHNIPRVFIGSSSESLQVAHAIHAGLAHHPLDVNIWSTDVFGPSRFPIQSLEEQAMNGDFAVLVLGPDDRVSSRSGKRLAPRDNVVLELGLFIGAFGHERVFMVVPQGADIKIPTDLLGLTQLRYKPAKEQLLPERLKPVSDALFKAFVNQGPR